MQQSVKILITGSNGECLPPPYGGIMKRCLLHAKEWKDKGAEVSLHIMYKHEDENDLDAGAVYFYDFPKLPDIKLKTFYVLTNFIRNPLLFGSLFFKLLRTWPENRFGLTNLFYAARGVFLDTQVKRLQPDIIVTETASPQSLAAKLVARRQKLPVVLENYAEIQFKADQSGINVADKYAAFYQYLLNNVDLVVPASRHCALGPAKYLKNPAKQVMVYSGINFEIFNQQGLKPKTELRRKFDLPQNKFLIMAVGALRMRKGHDQLFESILSLPSEELNKIIVVLCGMGPVEDLKRKADAMGFPHDSLRVFQGLPEEELAELYAAMDCFCFPSITPRECMGMAMKEAMSVGLPVAAYDTGGIKEAIEDGVNGYLAPTGDRQALAAALIKIMQLAPEARTVMSMRNVEKAHRLFDIKITAGQLYDQLIKLIDSSRMKKT